MPGILNITKPKLKKSKITIATAGALTKGGHASKSQKTVKKGGAIFPTGTPAERAKMAMMCQLKGGTSFNDDTYRLFISETPCQHVVKYIPQVLFCTLPFLLLRFFLFCARYTSHAPLSMSMSISSPPSYRWDILLMGWLRDF